MGRYLENTTHGNNLTELASEPMPPDSSGQSLFGATGQCAQSSLRRAWFSGTSHVAPSFPNLLHGVGTEARLCLPGEGWQPTPTPRSAPSICAWPVWAAHLHSSTQVCQLSLCWRLPALCSHVTPGALPLGSKGKAIGSRLWTGVQVGGC